MRSLLLAVSLASLATAQERAPERPPQATAVCIDAVVATVNDSPIMLSQLRTDIASRLRTLKARVGQVSPRDIEALQNEALAYEIDRHRMAQSAKSLGPLTPEQVEQLLKSELDRDKQEQVRNLGSMNEFSRELKRTGRTWPTYERDQRVGKLNEFAEEFAIYRRLQNQRSLFLTPRMLRETYAENRDLFVREAAAKVVQVRFVGSDAKARAAEAAVLWRQNEWTARQLTERFPGSLPIGEVVATSLAAELGAIIQFALAGPADTVSEPIAVGEGYHVAKVTEHVSARNGQFEDAKVQNDLRQMCLRRVTDEFRQQALERARQRTEVWELKRIQ